MTVGSTADDATSATNEGNEGTPSIQDSMKQVLAEQQAEQNPDESNDPNPAPPAPPDDEGTPSPDGGETGDDDTAAPDESRTSGTDDPDVDEGGPDPDKDQTTEPPANWSAEQKETFEQLGELGETGKKAQQVMLDHHKQLKGDHTRVSQELAEVRKKLGPVEDELKPFEDYMKHVGIDEAGFVRMLGGYLAGFVKDPKATIQHVAQQTGVDLTELADASLDTADDDSSDEVRRLKEENARLKRQSQGGEKGDIEKKVREFKYDTDEEGQLKHPHFDKVKGIMAGILQDPDNGVDPDDLETAYNSALRAHPELSKDVIDKEFEERRKREREEEEKRKRKEAEDAKRRAGVRPTSTSMPDKGDPNPTKGMDFASALKETAKEMGLTKK